MSDIDETDARVEPAPELFNTTVGDGVSTASADIPLPTEPSAPRPKRRGRRALLIVLLIVVVVAACGFGGFRYVAQQITDLSAFGEQLCGNLEQHRYDALYESFSDSLRARFSKADFSRYGSEIDQFEGSVLSCGQSAGNHYSLDAWQHTITVASLLNRQGTGAHAGNIRFLLTGDGWKVDELDAGFLGVSLDALKAFDNYCGVLMNENYKALYKMLAPSLRTQTEDQFVQTQGLRRQIDSIVLACALDGFDAKNTNASNTFSVHIQRLNYLGAGAITFGSATGGWVITAIAPTLQGRALAPFYLAQRWCSDLQSQNFNDAFGLLTSESQFGNSAKEYAAKYTGKTTGIKWLNCTPDPVTYQGDSYVLVGATIMRQRLSTHANLPGWIQFGLKQENATWKVDIVLYCGLSKCSVHA